LKRGNPCAPGRTVAATSVRLPPPGPLVRPQF
jgi:hypothetical protein